MRFGFIPTIAAAGAIALAVGGCTSTSLAPTTNDTVVTETFMVAAADPGIQLHVRNKHPAGVNRFGPDRIVLFVHGATYPSETGFDINLPGGSWLEYAAKRGFDAYLVDVRGYGRSTRPVAMSQPANANPPFADTADAVKDVGAAVEFIRKRRGVSKIDLVGWSWGTAVMGTYTAQNNDTVNRLVLYAPLYAMREAPPISGVGAYRAVQREGARQRGIRGIPADRVEEISPRAWFDQWFDGNLATDPDGARQSPPAVRAPNGVIKDIGEIWAKGHSPYDPGAIRVPTLLIIAEWDQDTPLYMAQDIFARMTNAPDKRFIILGEGTHAVALEKNRMKLIREVQQFLEE
jgi:pimeloyl-ACP methyl ester carboxylesterase